MRLTRQEFEELLEGKRSLVIGGQSGVTPVGSRALEEPSRDSLVFQGQTTERTLDL